MLNLHASHGEDREVRRQLRKASNRVLAIACAHESLYKNDDIGVLDIGDYLRDVCRDLNLSASGCRVEIAAPNGFLVATDRGISLALIAIELITNVAKYAYPGDAKGTIQVVLAKQEPDQLLLTIADSGVGLHQDFDSEKAKGLGVRIVTALARNLDAKLKVKARNPGSEFALQIPLRSVTSTQFQ